MIDRRRFLLSGFAASPGVKVSVARMDMEKTDHVRITEKFRLKPEDRVGYICANTTGEYAGYGLLKGFEYAQHHKGSNVLLSSLYLL